MVIFNLVNFLLKVANFAKSKEDCTVVATKVCASPPPLAWTIAILLSLSPGRLLSLHPSLSKVKKVTPLIRRGRRRRRWWGRLWYQDTKRKSQ